MRNKKTIAMIMLVVAIMAAMFGVLVACVDSTEPVGETVTVTFDTGGGTVIEPIKLAKGSRIETMPESPERDGYIFNGWYYDVEGNMQFDNMRAVDANITVYAYWDEIEPEAPPVDPTAPVRQKIDAVGALKKVFGGIEVPKNVVNVNFEVGAQDIKNNKNYLIELKTNAVGSFGNEFKFSVSEVTDVVAQNLNAKATVIDELGNLSTVDGSTATDAVKKVLFAIYMQDGKTYVQAEGTPMLYMEEFNSNYIISLVRQGVIKLGDMDILNMELGAGLTMDGIINLVLGMLFGSPDYYITQKVSHDITIPLNLNSFIGSLAGLLSGIDLGALLGMELNLGPVLDFLNKSIPPMEIKLKAHMEGKSGNGSVPKTTMLAFDVKDNAITSPDYKKQIFYMNINAGFGDAKKDIGIPTIEKIVPFSLTNMAFSLDFKLNTLDATGKDSKVDVGQIINMFIGNTTTALPSNLIMLDVQFGFRLKFAIDLNMNYDKKPVDLNRILIELWLIDKDGHELDIDGKPVAPADLIKVQPALSFVYKDSVGYINLGNLVPNYYGAKNVKVDLSQDDNGNGLKGIAGLIDGLVTLITDAVDKALGTNWDESNGGGALATAGQQEPVKKGTWKESDTLSMTVVDGKTAIISPGVTELVKVIAGVIGLQDYIKAEGDAITIRVNNGMMEKLLPMISKISGKPINFKFPDGVGDIVLAINLANYGIDNIEITGNINELNASIKLHQFWIGFEKENLDAIMTARIGDPANSTSSLKEVLDQALKGINLNLNIGFTIKAGTYDLAPMLLGFAPQLKPILGTKNMILHFAQDMTLDLTLRIRIALDKVTTTNSTLALEVVTNRAIVVGASTVIDKDAVILGIYGYNNKVYVGLSGIKFGEATLPNFSVDMDFTKLLYHFLNFKDINLVFDLESLVFPATKPNPPKNALTTAEDVSELMFASGGTTVDNTTLTAEGQILIGWNFEALTVKGTFGAVLQLLKLLNVQLNVDLTAIKDLKVDLSLGRTKGVTLDVIASILPRVDLDGNGKPIGLPTYGDDVAVHLETGTLNNPFYIGDISDIITTVQQEITAFKPFDIPAISFDLDILASTKTSTGGVETKAPVDFGAMINMLANSKVVPEGILMVNLEYGLRISFMIDLALKKETDESLMAIELFFLGSDGEPTNKLGCDLGLYYKNGSVYVDLSKLLPSFYSGKNIELKTSIKAVIDILLAKLQSTIDVALGGLYNPTPTPPTPPAPAPANLATAGEPTPVVPQTVIPAGYADLFKIIASVLNIENCVTATADKISISIGPEFFKGLSAVVGNIAIAWPKFLSEIKLDINVDEKNGIKSLEVNGSIFREVTTGNTESLAATLKVKNLNMRNTIPGLSTKIDNVVASKGLSNSLYDVFYDVLGNNSTTEKPQGINLSANIKLTFNKGKYDLAPLIAGFGLPQFANQHLLWEFKEDFVLDAILQVQISLNLQSPKNSVLVVELRTGKGGINIGGDMFIAADTVILGLYGYQNQIFLDVSNLKIANITLPKLKLDLNFTGLIDNIIKKNLKDMTFTFDIAGLLPKDWSATPSAAGLATSGLATSDVKNAMFVDGENAGNLATAPLTDAGKIMVGLNVNELTANVTLATILQLLSDMSVDMGKIDMSNWTASISLVASRHTGIAIDVDADLVPMMVPSQTIPGEFERKYGGSGLKLHMEAGSENYPIMIGDLTKIKYDLSKLAGSVTQYTDDVIDALVSTVGKANLHAKVNLKTLDSTMNLTKLINGILSSQGKEFNLPINLHLDKWDTFVDLDVAWNLDLKNSRNMQLKVEFTFDKKLLLGIYLYRGSIILDLTGFGFFKAELINTPFVKLITKELDNLVSGFGNFNLTQIIQKLLKDAGLSGYLPGANEGEVITTVVEGSVEKNAAAAAEVPMDWIEFVLGAVQLQNAKIFLNFDAEMIDLLFNKLLGFGLGLDIAASGNIDLIAGKITLGLKVEDISLDIALSLVMGSYIDLNLDVDSIPDWDATSGRKFADTMLDNLDIGFYLDLANKSGDTKLLEKQNNDTVTDNNALYTRIVIEKVKQDKVCKDTPGGIVAPAGTFLITVQGIGNDRYNNSSAGTTKDIAYVILNYKTGKLKIALGKQVLYLGAIYDLANAINIDVALDVVGQLGKVFDDLFKKIEMMNANVGKPAAEQAPAPQAAADPVPPTPPAPAKPDPFGDLFKNFDILSLFEGIDVTLASTGLFNVNASINAYTLNKLIDDIFKLLFGPNTILNLKELAPTMFSDNWLSYVDWDRMDAGKTWGTFKAKLAPILKDALKGLNLAALAPLITDAILGDIAYQIRQLLIRFIPFPIYNKVDVGINIMQGTLANIYILGYDHNEDVLDPQGKVYTYTTPSRNNPTTITHPYSKDGGSGRGADHMTEIWLYNTSPSVGDPIPGVEGSEGVMTWGDISTDMVYDPLKYSDNATGKTQFIAANFEQKIAKYQRAGQLSKTNITFKWLDGTTEKEVNAIDFTKRGVYTIQAKAVFNVAGNQQVTKTLNINLNVYSDAAIIDIGQENRKDVFVSGVKMYVYDELPDYLLVKTTEGERRVETKYMTFVDCAPTTYKAHTISAGKVTFKNNKQAPITINYLDSTISNVRGGMTINVDLYNFNVDPNNANKSTIAQYTPNMLYFQYSTGVSGKIAVNKWETADTKALFERTVDPTTKLSTNLDGGRYYITAQIGSGALAQTVEIQFVAQSKNINYLSIGKASDKTVIDPYQYYLYKTTGEEKYNPYPTEVEANYLFNGTDSKGNAFVDMYSEKVNILWNNANLADINYGWTQDGMAKRDTTVNFDNNKKLIDPTTKVETNKYSGSFTWSRNVGVEVVRNQVQGVFFDEKLTKPYFEIDPYLFNKNKDMGLGAKNFPSKAYVLMTNGNIFYLPIAWDKNIVDNYRPNYEYSFEQFTLTIGFDPAAYAKDGSLVEPQGITGGMLQSFCTNVIVLANTAAGVQIDGSALKKGTTFVIDPIAVLYQKKAAFPDTVTVEYTNKTTAVLPVTWEWDKIVTIAGTAELVAQCVITNDVKFPVTYRVIDRSAPYLADPTIKINSYKFTLDADGNRVYAEYTSTLPVEYKSGLWTVEVVTLATAETPAKTTIFDKLTTAQKDAKLVEYKDALLYTTKATEIIDKFDLPVTWNKDNVSYSVTNNYPCTASIVGGTTASEIFNITAQITKDKVFSVDGGMRVEGCTTAGTTKEYIDGVWVIIKGGSNISEEGSIFGQELKSLNVKFVDAKGYILQLDCTISLKTIDVNNATTKQLANGTTVQEIKEVKCFVMKGSDLQQEITIKYTVLDPNQK